MGKDKKQNVRKTLKNLNDKQIAADRQKIIDKFKVSGNALLIFDQFCNTPELDIPTLTKILNSDPDKPIITRQAITKIIDKLCDKKIIIREDPKTKKKIKTETTTGIKILSKVGNRKWGTKYRYDALCGFATDFANNTTQTINADGLYLSFRGREYAETLSETPASIKAFRPYKYHNDKPENAKSKHKLFIMDNLECMKKIKNDYKEKADLIYFDVPYRMVSSRFKLAYNDEFDGTCEYLSFLLPRLKLAKELLKPDGIIAVSIFENEMHYVKCLMDSVYGRTNIVNNVVIKTSVPAGPVSGYTQYRLPSTKSYLLIFAKDKSKVNYLSKVYTPVFTRVTASFNTILVKQDSKNPLHIMKMPLIDYLQTMPDIVKLFKKHKLDMKKSNVATLMECDKKFEEIMYNDIAPKLFQRVKPKGNPLIKGQKTHFNAPTDEVFELDGRLLEKTVDGTVYEFKCFSNKLVKNDDGSISNGEILSDIWNLTSEKSKIANEGSVPFFSKKPQKMLKMLIQMISGKNCDDFLICDFFAGSASTFEAALSMQDIKCHCILCQIDEPVQPGSEEYKAGFRRIPQITIKRMKNVIKKYPGEGFQIFRT